MHTGLQSHGMHTYQIDPTTQLLRRLLHAAAGETQRSGDTARASWLCRTIGGSSSTACSAQVRKHKSMNNAKPSRTSNADWRARMPLPEWAWLSRAAQVPKWFGIFPSVLSRVVISHW
jgi:hypothetical protein